MECEINRRNYEKREMLVYDGHFFLIYVLINEEIKKKFICKLKRKV